MRLGRGGFSTRHRFGGNFKMHVPELLARHALLKVQRALPHLLRDAVADFDVVRLVAADEPLRH